MLLSRARPKSAARRIWAVVGVVLTLIGAAIGIGDQLHRVPGPLETRSIRRSTTRWRMRPHRFATVATMIGGKPQIARIDDGPLPITTATGNIGFSEDHASAWLGAVPMSLTVLSPGDRRTAIFVTVEPGPGAPPLSASRNHGVVPWTAGDRPADRQEGSAACLTSLGPQSSASGDRWRPDFRPGGPPEQHRFRLLSPVVRSLSRYVRGPGRGLQRAPRPTSPARFAADETRAMRRTLAALKVTATKRPTIDGGCVALLSPWYGL